jgi:hypothetical protein
VRRGCIKLARLRLGNFSKSSQAFHQTAFPASGILFVNDPFARSAIQFPDRLSDGLSCRFSLSGLDRLPGFLDMGAGASAKNLIAEPPLLVLADSFFC